MWGFKQNARHELGHLGVAPEFAEEPLHPLARDVPAELPCVVDFDRYDVAVRRLAAGFRKAADPVAPPLVFANDGHGRLFEAVCGEFDRNAEAVRDHRAEGYCHYRKLSSGFVTVYRAPDPAPYAAANLEHLVSAGAETILFLNGTGSLRPDVPVGSVVLPGELVREEGTSFHYAPPEITLRTDAKLNERLGAIADSLGVALVAAGKHWTTDAIYRETFSKIDRHRERGVVSVEMELSALAGVAYHRGCALSALLVVTDVAARSHTWGGTTTPEFRRGVERAARIAARVFSDANP